MTDNIVVFHKRFPRLAFSKQACIAYDMDVIGLPKTLIGRSNHFSPIGQYSSIYDNPKYKIETLKNLKIDDKIVCLTAVELPSMEVNRLHILEEGLKLCAIAIDNKEQLVLVTYKQIQTQADAQNKKYHAIIKDADVIIHMPSSSKETYNFNSHFFVLVSHSTDLKKLYISPMIKAVSWRQTRRAEKRTSEQLTDARQEDYNFVRNYIIRNKQDHLFLARIKKFIQEDKKFEKQIPEADPTNYTNSDYNNNNNIFLHEQMDFDDILANDDWLLYFEKDKSDDDNQK